MVKRKIKKQNLIISIAVLILLLFSVCWIIFNSLNTKENNSTKIYCKQEQQGAEVCTADYSPVCGWFNQSIKCFIYPCAQKYSNACSACANPTVEFYTIGECPK